MALRAVFGTLDAGAGVGARAIGSVFAIVARVAGLFCIWVRVLVFASSRIETKMETEYTLQTGGSMPTQPSTKLP